MQLASEPAPTLGEYVFCGHCEHTSDVEPGSEKVPAGQMAHEVAPKMFEREPAWHCVQASAPKEEKKPGGHCELAKGPAGHCQPAWQGSAVLLEPAGHHFPAGQLRQVAAPSVAE